MNSRERVLQSMNFQQPDRVAIDFGAHRSSGIAAMAYTRLRDYLELPKRLPKVYDMPQQLAIIDDDVLERFHIDCIELGRGFCRNEADWKPWVLPNGVECLIPHWINLRQENGHWVFSGPDDTAIAIQKQGMVYFDQTCFPLMEDPEAKIERLEEMLNYNMWAAMSAPPGPVSWDEAGMCFLAEGARKFREQTDRAIVGLFGGSIFEGGQQLFRMDNFYVALATEPDLVHRFLDKLTSLFMQRLALYLKAVGPYIDIILFGDDYGMQTGPQISPAMFREFFKPRHQQLWQYAKKLAPVKVMLHSCGSISDLLPDMIEAGLDAVNPVQINCKKMEAERLKAAFKDQITFWGGGCNTQQILPLGTPAEVRADVLKNLDSLAPGGGFVFQQIHNIQADVPPENIVAMFDAVAEWNGMHA
ncbi:MAG: uroporphyrinogen decarboxylase family protein [Caldilineaceae bacterium]